MWPNPQENVDLVTFTEKKTLMENFIFCAVSQMYEVGTSRPPVFNGTLKTAIRRCFSKYVFLKTSQCSPENTCVGVSF